ncbi:MAG TPA: transglutaminase family protein [Sporichthyaceae bacterium]|jgi:transglutaminase-like putative cysteine protease
MTTWRLRVRHRTGIRYESPVLASYNEVRMTPLSDAGQTALETRVSISPNVAVARYRDYWGSQVTAFDVHTPHTEMVLDALSVVETHSRARTLEKVGWDALHDDRVRDSHVEFLTPTEHTAVEDSLLEPARAMAGGQPPAEAARAVADWLRDQVVYETGSTGVHTVAMAAWAERKGVCQDLAHLTVGTLRGLGIPARYISGYLHPDAEAEVGATVVGESHAWVQWWDGDWTSFDPTNGKPVGPEHVVVARGRDYWDVLPHKGVYSGPAGTALGVQVEVTRLA